MSEAVMTIHGFLTTTDDFGRLGSFLNMYDEVKHCEIPGHNGKPDFSKFTVESTVDAVLSCYDELKKKHEHVDVVGFSMGGALATYLCARRDVRKAVLLSPSNKFFNLSSPLSAMKFFIKFFRETYSVSNGAITERLSSVKKAFSPHLDNGLAASQIALKHILPNISLHTFTVFTKLMTMIDDVLDNAGKLNVPALVMWGRLDELVPFSSVEYVKNHFNDIKVNYYDDIGHAMLYTNRDNMLIHDIIKFLTDYDVEIPYMDRSSPKDSTKKYAKEIKKFKKGDGGKKSKR